MDQITYIIKIKSNGLKAESSITQCLKKRQPNQCLHSRDRQHVALKLMFERAKIKVSFFNYSFGKMFCVHGNCKIKTSTTLQQVQSKTHHKVSHITKNNKDYRCKFTKGQLRHTSYHKFLFNRAMLEGMKHLWAKEVYKGGTLYICSWCQPVFTIDRV